MNAATDPQSLRSPAAIDERRRPLEPEHHDGDGDARTRLSRMRTRHLGAVHALEQHVHDRPWSRGVFASEVARRDSRHYLVATRRRLTWLPLPRRVIGYAGVMFVADEAHITTVVVQPEHRREGVGRRLVAALLEEGRRRGATAATLEVRVTNTAARELYRGFGFVPVGTRRGYYPAGPRRAADGAGAAEDALIMWLHDLAEDD